MTDQRRSGVSLPPPGINYSRILRRIFYLFALTIALLPIPVALLQLVPTYRIHTKFLVFFAPLVCLLTLAYLFYIRDTLARLMFGHLLDAGPADGIYADAHEFRRWRVWALVRTTLTALLPACLILVSGLLLMRYTDRLEASLAVASVTMAEDAAIPDGVAMLTPPERGAEAAPPRRSTRPPKPAARGDDTAPAPAIEVIQDREARRRHVLEAASEVPDFRILTALYISPFLTALAALVLMGLREYAREALGLSERDVVMRRAVAAPIPE